MPKWIEDLIKEWSAVKAAPRSFLVMTIVVIGLVWAVMGWTYKTILDSKNAQIELLTTRLRNQPDRAKDVSTSSANRWEPLSLDETAALRAELKKFPREKLSVLCAHAGCADIADSIFSVAHNLEWTGNLEGGYLTDSGIQPGIQIWSYQQKAIARNNIADAIERATKSRLRISQREWEGQPTPAYANDINLIIGRVR